MEHIVKKSHLKILTKQIDEEKSWQSRFCVLRFLREERSYKLELYLSEDMCRSGGPNKVILSQDVQTITKGTYPRHGATHTFELTFDDKGTSRDSIVFAASDKQVLEEWFSIIQELVDKGTLDQVDGTLMPPVLAIQTQRAEHAQTLPFNSTICMLGQLNCHEVTIHDCAGAQKCGLSTQQTYLLQVTPLNLLLLETVSGKRRKVLAWPYKYIRRYGRSNHSFTFEAGRKCESGEGLFTFNVEDGEKIFKEVHLSTKAMKGNTATPSGNNTSSSSSTLSTSPPTPAFVTPPETPTSPDNVSVPMLPKRNYGNVNEYKQSPVDNKGSESPKTPDREKHKKNEKFYNIRDAITAPLRSIGDHLKHRGSSEDTSPLNSLDDDIHGSIGAVGTPGKYTTSPNMRQRGLPPIPDGDNNTVASKTHKRSASGNVQNNNKLDLEKKSSFSPHMPRRSLPQPPPDARKLSHDSSDRSNAAFQKPPAAHGDFNRTGASKQEPTYALYDDQNRAEGNVYEGTDSNENSSQYMLSTHSGLAHGAGIGQGKQPLSGISSQHLYQGEHLEVEDDYSSIDEDKPQMEEQYTEYSDPRTFKMSDLLAQTKTTNKEKEELQEDYSTPYAAEYDSIDLLKSVGKGGHTRPVSHDINEEDSHTYGVLSLGSVGSKKGKKSEKEKQVEYVNTATSKKS